MKSQHQPSRIWSTVTVLSSLAILFYASEWRNDRKNQVQHSKLFSPGRDGEVMDLLSHRSLLDQMSLDDDEIHFDDTCRDYLQNFMNGTTDVRDKCDALVNALTQAGCHEDRLLLSSSLGRQHKDASGNLTDDDIVPTDDIENRYCCRGISKAYGKHCEKEEQFAAGQLLGIVSVLVVCGLAKSALKFWNTPWIPDAMACIVVGSLVGGLLRLIEHEAVREEVSFDNDLFLQVLLPPIIFEASLSIDKRAFRRDLFPILTFSIFGTGFSAVAIGYITYYTSRWFGGIPLPFVDSLLFGALMSSIDPVAVLGILSGVGVRQDDQLYILIFGESLLNDGVSIVLFDSLVRHTGDADVVDEATVRSTLSNFFYVIAGSIMVGAMCGAIGTLYFWFLQGKHHDVSEVALFFCWALIPYYIADGFGNSGIISIMVMGFMMDYFVIGGFEEPEPEWGEYSDVRREVSGGSRQQMSGVVGRCKSILAEAFAGKGLILDRSRQHVGFVAEVVASLMETAIFAYLGVFLFNDQAWNFMLTASGIVACVFSRFVMVLGLGQVINACVWMDLEGLLSRVWRSFRGQNYSADYYSDDDKQYLDPQTQMVLFAAGVRGAVSYALVQNIPVFDSVTKEGSHYKGELKAMTSATIVILLVALGALVYHRVQKRPRQGIEDLTDRLVEQDVSMPNDLHLREQHSMITPAPMPFAVEPHQQMQQQLQHDQQAHFMTAPDSSFQAQQTQVPGGMNTI